MWLEKLGKFLVEYYVASVFLLLYFYLSFYFTLLSFTLNPDLRKSLMTMIRLGYMFIDVAYYYY